MGTLFKKADKGATDVYYFGEEGDDDRDFIRVRASLTKGEANDILLKAPTENKDLKGAFNFLDTFFAKVIVDWSLTDDEGNPLPCTLDQYKEMDAGSARLIQDKLGEHLNKVLGREIEVAEGESSS